MTEGRVLLDGQPIQGLSPTRIARAGLMRMFQLTRVFRRMSALENLLTTGRALALRAGKNNSIFVGPLALRVDNQQDELAPVQSFVNIGHHLAAER